MDFAIFRLFIRVSLFVIALIACIIYLIINKQYSYAEGYVTEQAHGGADVSSERRSIFLYDEVTNDEIEFTVFSRYVDKHTYLKIQYLPHTKYGAILEDK